MPGPKEKKVDICILDPNAVSSTRLLKISKHLFNLAFSKVAFSQKVLMPLSFPHTDEPFIFLKLEI